MPPLVHDLLKTLGEACEFDFVPDLSSHSFRRGLSTSAARERVDFELIKKQGGWKNDATVWEYIEDACLTQCFKQIMDQRGHLNENLRF